MKKHKGRKCALSTTALKPTVALSPTQLATVVGTGHGGPIESPNPGAT
jgi:hypothetical protein